MEIQRFGHFREAVLGIELLSLMRLASQRPDGVQAPVIEADEVALAGDQAGAHAAVVGAEIVEIPFGGEALGADGYSVGPMKLEALENRLGYLPAIQKDMKPPAE